MPHKIVLRGIPVSYILKESNRAKRINVSVHRDGTLVVARPRRVSERDAISFLKEKTDWILSCLKEIEEDTGIYLADHSGSKLTLLQEYAGIFIARKISEFNEHYGFPIGRVSVKNQRSQWGSCTARKDLNFTYKVVLLPLRLAEYVIVHELCHIREFSHSRAFWSLVQETIPDWKKRDRELNRYYLR